MATTIIELPQVGESVTEGIISRWLVKPGQSVQKYEPLVEVMTDKVNMEVPAPYSGTFTRALVEEGETVPMGQPIAEMDVDADVAAAAARDRSLPISEQPSDAAMGYPQPRLHPHPAFEFVDSVRSVGPTGSGEGGRGRPDALQEAANAAKAPAEDQRLSPLVKRLVEQHNVDASKIRGTGVGGRITKEDVVAHVERQEAQPGQAQRGEGPALTPSKGQPAHPDAAEGPPPTDAIYSRPRPVAQSGLVPLTPLRKIIAEHMVQSAREIPAAWTMVEADVTELVRYRERFRESFEKTAGAPLTYLPFAAHVVSRALRFNPTLNARWTGDGIEHHGNVHLGIAVATEQGLIVPVIRNADTMDLRELALRANELIDAARRGALKLEDVQDGTFTLNNTGALGSVISMPIINHPQAAILTTEAIVKRPVVVQGDAIAVRSMMNICLTFDHRVCDGAEAGRFLAEVKSAFEAIDETSGLL